MHWKSIAEQLPWAKGARLLACDANGLLAVEKPAGLLSHPNKKGDAGRSLLGAAYDFEEQAYRILDTGENVERRVYLLNRLDSATSGIVLLALEEAVARAALAAFEAKQVRKTYCALVFGAPRGGQPLWRDRLTVRRQEGGLRAQAGGGGGLSAETKLLKAEPYRGPALMSRLTLMPLTGRTHQLRLQAAKRKLPIVGDRTYGDFSKNKLVGKVKALKRLCLHCAATELEYRLDGKVWRFKAFSEIPF